MSVGNLFSWQALHDGLTPFLTVGQYHVHTVHTVQYPGIVNLIVGQDRVSSGTLDYNKKVSFTFRSKVSFFHARDMPVSTFRRY